MIDNEHAATGRNDLQAASTRPLAHAPIGVFDSGVGGLAVLQAIHCDLPYEDLVYCADSGYAPYGDKSDDYILDRCHRIGAWLAGRGVKAIVVACNTATAAAVQALRARWSMPIVGIEPGLKPAILDTVTGRIGVLATTSTLASERYARLLARIQAFAPEAEFIPAPGIGWVELVEAGDFDSARARALVRAVVEPLIERGVDTLVLGCTHYPFLRGIIAEAAPGISIVDTAPAIAREIARRVRGETEPNPGPSIGRMRLVTTGDDTHVTAMVERMLGTRLAVEAIRV